MTNITHLTITTQILGRLDVPDSAGAASDGAGSVLQPPATRPIGEFLPGTHAHSDQRIILGNSTGREDYISEHVLQGGVVNNEGVRSCEPGRGGWCAPQQHQQQQRRPGEPPPSTLHHPPHSNCSSSHHLVSSDL